MSKRGSSLGKRIVQWFREIFVGKPPATKLERRAWIRFSCDLQTSFRAGMDTREELFPAKLCNISRGGVSIQVGRYFEPNTIVTVEIERRVGEAKQLFPARVVRATADGKGETWVMGCIFMKKIDDKTLRALGKGNPVDS